MHISEHFNFTIVQAALSLLLSIHAIKGIINKNELLWINDGAVVMVAFSRRRVTQSD
jgi:hypothetical protein